MDLVETIPVVGHFITGARSGSLKAEDHYTVASGKAAKWLEETKVKAKTMFTPDQKPQVAKA